MRLQRFYYYFYFCCYILLLPCQLHAGTPALLLAKTYQQNTAAAIDQYWVSEKYDGVRALWNGTHLVSRQGNIFHAPDWFTEGFPAHALDGELWLARNRFEELVSIVSKDQPVDAQWRQVRYMVFELPGGEGTFTERLQQLEQSIAASHNPHLYLAEQFRLPDQQALQDKLEAVTRQGAEGLMLHRADALYHTGRSDDLLKVKRYQDAEATVIAQLPGKGKYRGMMGALLVEDSQGRRFRIGTGFSDQQRRHPPAIGTLITYKYYGLTRKGVPRFASFLRVRADKMTK